jgi:ribosomal protein L37AE/L43A
MADISDKLRDKEKAEEDRYFAQRDRELLEKLKQEQAKTAAPQALMQCPKCGVKLNTVQQHEITVEECPSCQGMWLDRGNTGKTRKRRVDDAFPASLNQVVIERITMMGRAL